MPDELVIFHMVLVAIAVVLLGVEDHDHL
jgi:hypothetical protein